jgi:hypothetical protein
MDDDYEKEILQVFDNTKISSIDLSKNNLKKTALLIGRKLKDEYSHIIWLDLTQNDFDGDAVTTNSILNGLKKQKDLFYVGLSTHGS